MAQKKKKERLIAIGTSGWHYKSWKGPFYPEDIRPKDFLEYYKGYFKTTEINNSFYNMPDKKTLDDWKEIVPADFIFAAKASRYITHMKRLKDPKQPVGRFMKRARTLGTKLGPVLFQLPPRWGFDGERLGKFLDILPEGERYTLEFRDDSWFNDRTYKLLAGRNAAFCIYDLDGRLSPFEVTADFVYVRLHGPKGPYQGEYTGRRLRRWANAITGWAKDKKDVYCYFDNDQNGYAAKDAAKLREMLREEGLRA